MSLEAQSASALSRDPSLNALWFDGAWYNWGDLRAIADEINRLLDAAGLGARDPVGFLPRNRP